ncbi:MAG: putative bifunctional diguanylate cyclase/phosphodiesterase [Geminicoccales bacterium]
MAEEVAFKKRLEEDLRDAISAGALHVAYQPQVLTKCESLIGVEALARWHHPQFGEISPVTFIKVAEDCGLIDELSDLVLDRACDEISALMSDLGRDIRLSVNISTKQFYEGCIAAKIAQALQKWNFDPKLLEIEVTETVFIRNMEETRSLLHAIRDMGVRIALDDFGTGFSSLSYLRQFEVDRIKLDREFIKDICWSKYDEQVLLGILKLAQSLEIETIAEGVEDVQQRDILERYGCDEIQGYFYSRPLSISRFRQMIELRWPRPDAVVGSQQTVSAA